MADAAPDRGFEPDPGLGDATALGGLTQVVGDLETAGLHPLQILGEHVADAVRSFDGDDVPGERDEIAPVTVLSEELSDGLDITCGECGLEGTEPLGDDSACGALQCCGHRCSFAGLGWGLKGCRE